MASEKMESPAIAIKAAADEFQEMYTCRPHHTSIASPQIIKKVELSEGQWGQVGNVTSWEYLHDGKLSMSKAVLETINYDKKTTSYRLTEGEILKLYKSMVIKLQVFPKEENNSIVSWTLEYEKKNEGVPDPCFFVSILVQFTKDIDAHLTRAA